jgi:hypothetical protein
MEKFKIEAEVKTFLQNVKIENYLVNEHNKIENLFEINCIDKIKENENIECLNVIFGEVTQKVENFIYSNNKNIGTNSFLRPSTLLEKPCGKKSNFKASELHEYLKNLNIVVIDLFCIPLPSDYYRKNLVGNSKLYLKYKSDIINSLIEEKKIKKIKAICRYKDENIIALAEEFLSYIKLDDKDKNFEKESYLSSEGGFLDMTKFKEFTKS